MLSFCITELRRNTTPTQEEVEEVEDDIEDYKEAFQLLDVDKNGEITKSDLDNFIKARLGKSSSFLAQNFVYKIKFLRRTNFPLDLCRPAPFLYR